MSLEEKIRFFDGIAEKWDAWEDLDALAIKFSQGLDEIGLGADERVVDVGCGTGNLTRAILGKLSPAGRIFAIDCSSAMVAMARRKIEDPRISWFVDDATRLPMDDGSVDRVICCSVWPHLENSQFFAKEVKRVLRVGGRMHVWHLSGRETINDTHATAGEAVRRDILVPAEQTAGLLKRSGLVPTTIVDDDQRYLVTAEKPLR